MNPVAFVRALPQPTRAVYALFLVTVVVAFAVMFAVGATGGDAFVAITVPGALMVVIGVLQLLDVRGTASAMARHLAGSRPLGVDYSRSFMATPRYVRLLGLGFVVIGLFWCALGLGLVE